MTHIAICEVGPRDGLQSEPRIWSAAERIALIDSLSAAGLRHIEAASFVNPKRVPQMADAEAVMAGIERPEGSVMAGLALNRRGAERALAAGCDEVRFVAVASETFSVRNQGAGIQDTLAACDEVGHQVHDAGRRFAVVVAAAFGCPFEGVTPPERVVELAARARDAGAGTVVLADTIGAAVPTQVTALVGTVRQALGAETEIGCHFHNTRNTGFANAVAAIDAGVRLLDSSVGGIGGCPFAPRATGNVCTEDLAYMLRNMGHRTGIDLEALIEVSRWAETFFAAPLPGQLMKAGPFPESARAR